MPDEAFSRVVINPRERPLSSDINQLQSEAARTMRELVRAMFLRHALDPAVVSSSFTPISGFLGDGFFVTAGGALTHTIKAGLGFIFDSLATASDIGGVSKVDDRSPYYPAYLSADQTISSPAAPGIGLERVDIIEVALDRRLADSSSRDVLNTGTGIFDPTLELKTLAFLLDGRTGVVASPGNSTTGISLKSGSTQAAGTYAASNGVTGVPATTAGYTRIGVIIVTNAGAVVQGDVRDERFLMSPDGRTHLGFTVTQVPGSPNDTITIGQPPNMPAGWRVAAHQVSSPSNGGTMRVYMIGGRTQGTNQAAQVVASCKAVTIANANRLCRMTPAVAGVVTSAIKTSLAGPGGSTAFAAAVGQEFISFDIDATRLIDIGDPNDTNRVIDISAAISSR